MTRIATLFAAAAATFATPAVSAGITYDCDTAAGHFSELVLPAPAGAFTVTGLVRINQVYADKQWMPVAKVMTGPPPSAPGEEQPAFAGFSFGALPGKAVSRPEKSVQFLSFLQSGKEDEIVVPSLQAVGSIQRFTLALNGATATVALGGDSRSYSVPAGPQVVRIICSTGEFLFTELAITANP